MPDITYRSSTISCNNAIGACSSHPVHEVLKVCWRSILLRIRLHPTLDPGGVLLSSRGNFLLALTFLLKRLVR